MQRKVLDRRLPVLLGLLDQLLEATRVWARGDVLDPCVETIRHQALLINHVRYVDLIPAYRKLAEQAELVDVGALDPLVNGLMVSDEFFKSYSREWLAQRDFTAMASWLDTLFTHDIPTEMRSVTTIEGWRERLREADVFLAYSSGTSGQLSFVPRDRLTMNAMQQNGGAYLHGEWPRLPDGSVRPFDCLVLGPRGRGMGLLTAGLGLSRMATRAHFLFDSTITADEVWERPDMSNTPSRIDGRTRDAAFAMCAAFVREVAAAKRPLVVFGPPFLIQEFCNWSFNDVAVRAPPDSLVISGGGWKTFGNRRVPHAALHALVETTLGIPREHVIDTYGATELNCVLMSCRESHYHVPPLLEAVVLDEAYTGSIGDEGEGVLGFLDPFALSYPGFVISGDTGKLVRDRCACGLSGASIVDKIERAPNQNAKGCAGVLASTLA